jgi:hypothetical protein
MILPLLVLLMAPVCRAGPAEQVYFTARDPAIAMLEQKFNSLEPAATDKFQAEYNRASGAVEAQLRRLMGPVPPPKGVSGAGTLDGILFRNGHDIVLVTTEGLLRHWLEENSKAYHFPTDPAAALRSDDFYTPAIGADAAVSIFAPLPIRAPAGASAAVALLGEQTQALPVWPPNRIAVSLVKSGWIYIALVEPTLKLQPIAACDAALKELTAKASAAFTAGDSQTAIRLEAEGAGAFQKCWAERARKEGALAAPTRQAQAFAHALASP